MHVILSWSRQTFAAASRRQCRIDGPSDNTVMLLKAHCVVLLTGIKILYVRDNNEKRKQLVAYNAVYRQTFGYTHCKSVTELQQSWANHLWRNDRKDSLSTQTASSPRRFSCTSFWLNIIQYDLSQLQHKNTVYLGPLTRLQLLY